MRARWLPRLQNEEADIVINSEFRLFEMANRIDVDLNTLPLVVLNSLCSEGDAYVKELEFLKTQEAVRVKGGGG